jgi:hypothetical protein
MRAACKAAFDRQQVLRQQGLALPGDFSEQVIEQDQRRRCREGRSDQPGQQVVPGNHALEQQAHAGDDDFDRQNDAGGEHRPQTPATQALEERNQPGQQHIEPRKDGLSHCSRYPCRYI